MGEGVDERSLEVNPTKKKEGSFFLFSPKNFLLSPLTFGFSCVYNAREKRTPGRIQGNNNNKSSFLPPSKRKKTHMTK
jgi:hypothetical protein